MVVSQSFRDHVTCESGFEIKVINAHYGYHHAFNRNIRQSCSTSTQPDDCFVSVPLYSSSYYTEILDGCNGRRKCDSNLRAKQLDGETSCGSFSVYVSVQFYCLPSDKESKYNQIIYFKNSSKIHMHTYKYN